MKKILLLIVFTISSLFTFTYWQWAIPAPWSSSSDFPYSEWNEESIKDSLNHSKFGEIANDFADTNEIQTKQSPIAYWISKIINYFLALLSFIAVIVLIYWFSLVFANKTDEWVKKWYKYVKFATIAIIIIWISWLISSWFFYIYNEKVLK